MKYNPFSFEMHKDPYAVYDYLLEHEPVQHNAEQGFWAISRFEDVWAASRDWETYSSSCGPILGLEMPMPILLSMDPPAHQRMRSLVSTAFTPGSIQALESDIRNNVGRYLDALGDQPVFEFNNSFAAKFPMDTISAMLGIPEADRENLQRWSHDAMHRDPGVPDFTPAGIASMEKSVNYFAKAISDRRKQPMNDIMSKLVHVKAKTETGETRGLGDDELLGFLLMLVSAGYETVMRTMGIIVYHLYKRPDIRQQLMDNPALIPNAIEELMRFDNVGQYLARVLTREVEVQGVKIPKGSKVILLHGAAMRDKREFKQPDTIDIHRQIERKLAFGNGPHLCLGASLARLELKIGLEAFLQRFPGYSIDESRLVYSHSGNVRGFDALTIHR